jgi:hypothetical protein
VQQKRVAVGSGIGDHGGADRPSAARPVLDDESLADLPRHLVEHDARDDFVGGAGAKRDDRLDGPRRPRLRIRRRGSGGKDGACDGAA